MKCQRTEGDGLPKDAEACRYHIVTQRQGNIIVTQKTCIACGDQVETRAPVSDDEKVADAKNQFEPKAKA